MEPVEDLARIIRQLRHARRQGTASVAGPPNTLYTIPVSYLALKYILGSLPEEFKIRLKSAERAQEI